VPDAVSLLRADVLVFRLAQPVRDLVRRALVAREHLDLVADLDHLQSGDQLHQRPGAEAAAGVDRLAIRHRDLRVR